MLTVCCWYWEGDGTYSPDDVRRLKRQVAANLSIPHEFVCVTDETFDDMRTVPIWKPTHVQGRIFDRVSLFQEDYASLIGDRIFSLDLDVAVTGLLAPIVERDEPLVMWRNPARVPYWNPTGKAASRAYYNTSAMLITPGVEPRVYAMFRENLGGMPRAFRGDQDYIAKVLGPGLPHWDQSNGIYRLEREDTPGSGIPPGPLPDDARLVCFVGSEHKPDKVKASYPWVADAMA